jgi:VanZ family protein
MRPFSIVLQYIWLLSLTLGTRYILGTTKDFGIHQDLEYRIFFVPLALITSLAVIYVHRERLADYLPHLRRPLVILAFLALFASIGFSRNPLISAWWSLLTISILGAGLVTAKSLRASEPLLKHFTWAVLFIGVFQAALALLQFATGHDFGLQILGEPKLQDDALGIAKVIIDGQKLIRPYGTFPHTNVLAGFLVTVIYIVLVNRRQIQAQVWRYLVLGLLTFTLFITFSRSGWLAFALVIVAVSLTQLRRRLRDLIPAGVGVLLAAFLWLPGVLGRLNLTSQEQQLLIRSDLSRYAGETIISQPLFGVGPHAFVSSLPVTLSPFERQPVHSVPLLLVSENGILVFLILTSLVVLEISNAQRRKRVAAIGLVLTLLVGLGLLDHYLVTLTPGLGMIAVAFCLYPNTGLFVSRETKNSLL